MPQIWLSTCIFLKNALLEAILTLSAALFGGVPPGFWCVNKLAERCPENAYSSIVRLSGELLTSR